MLGLLSDVDESVRFNRLSSILPYDDIATLEVVASSKATSLNWKDIAMLGVERGCAGMSISV